MCMHKKVIKPIICIAKKRKFKKKKSTWFNLSIPFLHVQSRQTFNHVSLKVKSQQTLVRRAFVKVKCKKKISVVITLALHDGLWDFSILTCLGLTTQGTNSPFTCLSPHYQGTCQWLPACPTGREPEPAYMIEVFGVDFQISLGWHINAEMQGSPCEDATPARKRKQKEGRKTQGHTWIALFFKEKPKLSLGC